MTDTIREGIWHDDRDRLGHRWGAPVNVGLTRVERACAACPLIKVTMIMPRSAWREWRWMSETRSWRGPAPQCRGSGS